MCMHGECKGLKAYNKSGNPYKKLGYFHGDGLMTKFGEVPNFGDTIKQKTPE